MGAGFKVSEATAWRYVDETLKVLAAWAPGLHEALVGLGEGDFVIADGTLIPADRIRADEPHYSQKHQKHGMNVQVITMTDALWRPSWVPRSGCGGCRIRPPRYSDTPFTSTSTAASTGSRSPGPALPGGRCRPFPGPRSGRHLRMHRRPMDSVLLSPDGRTLATAERSGARYAFGLRDTRLLHTLASPTRPTSRTGADPAPGEHEGHRGHRASDGVQSRRRRPGLRRLHQDRRPGGRCRPRTVHRLGSAP